MDVLFRDILEKDQTGTLVLPEGYTPELAELLKSRLEQNLGDAVGRVRFLPAMSHMDYMNVMALAMFRSTHGRLAVGIQVGRRLPLARRW